MLRDAKRLTIFVAVALTAFAATPLLYPAASRDKIGGVVTNRLGKVVAGASVRVTSPERGLTVAIISQNGGRYETPRLPVGKYIVQGLGGGLQSEEATVEVDGNKSVTVNLALTGSADFRKTASMSDFASLMPDSEAKTLIVSLCTDCHRSGLQEIFLARQDRIGWTQTLAKMRNHPYGFYRSLEMSPSQQSLILDYLTQHFATGDTSIKIDDLPKPWVTGLAAKGIVTELKLPDGTDPHDVAVDSTGIGWISESGPGNIGRYDPRTFAYTRIPLPGPKSGSTAIAVDAQDRVWVADTPQARLVRYDPKSETFDSYPLPKPLIGNTNIVAIRFSTDGDVWASEIVANQVVRLDPATKEIRTYRAPAGVSSNSSVNPAGIAIDGDQTVWFTEEKSDKIAKIDSKTGEITEYDLPTPGAVPRRMATDARGNLWFGEFAGLGKLATFDYRSAKITEFPTPTKYSGAYSVSVDSHHNLIWVNEMMADQIARFDPHTRVFVEYGIPTRNSLVRRIEVDPSRPNRVWFAGSNADTFGFLDVSN